jgi:hypothetical protein
MAGSFGAKTALARLLSGQDEHDKRRRYKWFRFRLRELRRFDGHVAQSILPSLESQSAFAARRSCTVRAGMKFRFARPFGIATVRMGRVTEVSMLRVFIAVAAGALFLSSIAPASAAAVQPPMPQQKHHASRWHGYGFLPGYPYARANRASARGAQLPAGLAALPRLRPGVAHVLQQPLERRRFRSLLHADADRPDLELRALASVARMRQRAGARSRAYTRCCPKWPAR